MEQVSNIEKLVPRMYRRSALNLLMFGYINGVRSTLHTVTVKEAVLMFMRDFQLDSDDFNEDSASVIYYRMYKENKLVKQK